jgi:hypothetical protein
MPKKTTINLESITVKGKYSVPETNFDTIEKSIRDVFVPRGWLPERIGESLELMNMHQSVLALVGKPQKEITKIWQESIKKSRYGFPIFISMTAIEHLSNSLLVEVECRPAMWYKIATFGEEKFTGYNVKEALLECQAFGKRFMSILKGREVEAFAVYPVIRRTEIKSRLLNIGLKDVVDHLEDAEKHIVQNNFAESLTSSRTSFEKMIDWQMKKRGLEHTNNYRNDLDRLRAKGYLDPDTTQLLQSYYHCLSTIGVHEKGIPPGFYEAQMGYGITLIMLDYFANKLP